ncbi:ubiquinone biosynthesis O-methyltransferase, mitochondrial isoform X2 [Harpegnathos saltator]|uniref:ubiquinone biosynthesis O-methyltransferase, mitochondrial isoform X2 n=1 Tax=Harpegnathos saltator TaxID=610380 RepID=UPI000DBEF15E|nr:ubiquinone biosynthesis O-methyltransferase, mitochondrial isoform X2 [Harpegnathos saltator]
MGMRLKKVNYTLVRSTSTINIKDIKYYSKIKNDWWDTSKNGIMLSLHLFNPLRVQFIRDGLANTGFKEQTPSLPLQGVKIADVGCGGGILTEALARTGAQVTGVDASEELINVAKLHAELDSNISKNINYVQTSIEEFSSKNEKLYDAVISSEVIEHVYNQELFLKECVKLLKPGGSIFITTLNKTLISWFLGIIIAEYVINIIPRGIHDWNNFIPPCEIQRILEKNGCKTKLIHGIIYNPISMKWSWSSNTILNYGLHAVKKKEIDV